MGTLLACLFLGILFGGSRRLIAQFLGWRWTLCRGGPQ